MFPAWTRKSIMSTPCDAYHSFVMKGQQADAVSDADLRGVLRHRGEPHLGCGHYRALVQEGVLDREDVGEADLLGHLHLLERLPEAVGHRRLLPRGGTSIS